MDKMKKTNWVEKHRPKFFSDVKGQEETIVKLKQFLENFNKKTRDKKSLLLHGPPGVGKTTLAHVAANETNSEIFELNASDLRNSDKMKNILKPATEQRSLTKKSKIILVDEVDGISGIDRGGVSELKKLIESTPYPMIITANDIWNKKFNDIRKKSETIKLKEVNYKTIRGVMIDILRREKKFLNQDLLTNISLKAKGDLRAAINDLQIAANLPNPEEILFDERNKETDIFSAMKMIFKGKPNNSMLKTFDSIDMPIEEILLWIEENVPSEYQKEELERAFSLISRADIFKKRIYRQQYWRFLVYKNIFLSYGISSSKKTEKPGFTSYKRPSRILKIWLNNRKNEKKKSIAKKYARYVHIGEKRAIRDFPIIVSFLKKPEVQKELKLSEEEIAYLEKQNAIAKS